MGMATNHSGGKTAFSVLIGHRGCVGDAWQMMLTHILEAEYDLRFFSFGDDAGFDLRHRDELLNLTKEQRFDLIMLYLFAPARGKKPARLDQSPIRQAHYRFKHGGAHPRRC